jgi:hypothetical protein
MNHLKFILIIGKIPQPVGGVRVHVQRLTRTLEKRGYTNFKFFDLEQNPLWHLPVAIKKSTAVHLHTSNPWFQLLITLFCRMLQKPVIVTYHSNWGRYGWTRNLSESVSAFLAHTPIVQNEESLSKAKKINPSCLLMSTFIPPLEINPLPEEVLDQITKAKKKFRFLFCTTAWNLTFDKYGKEIYGITAVVDNIMASEHSALIISDPSGNYRRFMEGIRKNLPENILWVTQPHDFWNILEHSHSFIRNTTTDGTALSIQEAFCCGTVVFASDSVSRDDGCHVYHDLSCIDLEKELESALSRLQFRKEDPANCKTVDEILQVYATYLS